MSIYPVHTALVADLTIEMREEEDEMAVAGMPVIEIPKDSTNTLLQVQCVDKAHNALDVSGGGSVIFYARTIDGTAVVSGDAGAYTTDGSDGVLEFNCTAALVGTERDLWCEFEVTGLTNGSSITKLFTLRVMPRAKVSA